MILFHEDWGKYPTAIVDYDTKNKSFLEYCSKLQKIGIRNCLFPLSLINPKLKGVDPFDSLLSAEYRAHVFMECKINIWYYLREVHRIAPMASAEGIPFKAHRGNIAYVWCCMLHLTVGLTLPRQLGKSVVADAVDQWAKDIAARNTNLILVTKDDDLRIKNIQRLKKTRALLPAYVSNISKKDIDNQAGMSNVFLGNMMTTAIGQPSIEGANKAARGLTSPIFHFDESPFTKNIEIMVKAALPAYIAASAEAAQFGNPYYIGFTTTAGKMDDKDGAFVYKMFHEGLRFTETLFDCVDRDQVIDRIRRSSIGDDDLIYIDFLHYQLGYDDEWLYRAMAKTHTSGQEADRDYFNIWTNGTAQHPLSKKVLDAIIASRQDPQFVEISDREYSLNWYINESDLKKRISEDRKMIGGIDMSDGIGNDYITLVIIDESDLGVLGTFSAKEVNLMVFIEWICDLMQKYPNLIINPENKSTAPVLIDYLMYKLPPLGIDPLKRIYNRIVDENLFKDERYVEATQTLSRRSMQFYERNKTLFGFRTSGAGKFARNKLYSQALQKAGNFGGDKVRDSALASEIGSLSVRDGRIDHASGLHDDRVVAWMLAVWMLSFSKNLSYYGITRPLANASDLSRNPEDEIILSDYDRYKLQREEDTKMQIAKRLDAITIEKDPIIVDVLQREIRVLESRLSSSDTLPRSIDELIGEAVKLRRERMEKYR